MNEEHAEQYRECCENLEATFTELADDGVISRAPTKQEIEKVKPLLKAKIETDDWGFSTGELVGLLCSVSSVKNLEA